MEIFKVKAFISGLPDEGQMRTLGAIQHAGNWWIVASWLQSPAGGSPVPERLVRLDGLQFQEMQGKDYRFQLLQTLPKSVLDGRPQTGYVLSTYPAIAHTQGPTSVN